MTPMEAQDTVFKLLASDLPRAAQAAVMEIESRGATLSSSMFERVLRVALASNALTPEYEAWLKRAYGEAQWPGVLARALTRS